MRNHLKIFYDALWAEHIRLSTGKLVKPFKDRHEFGKMQLSDGFINEKPEWFHRVDDAFATENTANYIITLADQRMMMGDYRYGRITRQNLDNYDVISEFWRRRKIAVDTENLEYIVDMYNMVRIQSHKDKKIPKYFEMFKKDYRRAVRENWQLISIDDGIHAVEK